MTNKFYLRPHIDNLIAWENGELSEADEISMFQSLVDSGLVWKLQGMYGRNAARLIAAGLVHMPEADADKRINSRYTDAEMRMFNRGVTL